MPSIVPSLEWLAGLAWTTAIRESPWGYPITETAHVASIVVFAGLVIVMDLRLLGLAFTQTPPAQFQRRLFPWQMAAFVPSTATGLFLCVIDPLRYYGNVFFSLKLLLLALAGLNALLFHLRTYRRAGQWDEDPRFTALARLGGGVSLFLWSAVIVAGRFVAFG
jgi:hypothetical protein